MIDEIKRRLPIKNVLVFRWVFDEATSLSEIEERFKGYYYITKPRPDILVTSAFIKPYVICVLIQRSDDGGDLLVIQTFAGRYPYEKVVGGAYFYAMRAGIKIIKEEPEDIPKPYFMDDEYKMKKEE
ncbi:MAG TPA: hypothetical protein ENG09_05365 [Candidatus Syntrophoarchaeum butanivorans]|uniref:Uncharacterized protein n=1 Tax=Candidatus Syntropharchaeum butanivorans TaxID=1839936 RepID=A0A1F2P2X3_9EURY|nr:MAG: hypothetical protein SBU_001574 [Candidatus Syntrophoarchaeum butanivorans]RJS72331.1 MAG: hypothetical protein CW694_03080 [Candidatus Syntrophoarchaeum sp. WYZ-LMO15]HDM36658.1 hypothetical protein [Candidatus Syntrophoarchaeum butanivorans]HEC56727.1 hypothetical protein [Candidatus Syntrophoarchaeum butanivorans]